MKRRKRVAGTMASSGAVETSRDMTRLEATSTPVWPELEALKAVMDGDNQTAVEVVRSMTAKDRAILLFCVQELTGITDDVNLSEKRWSVEP